MVNEHLFQYGDKHFHILQLKTECHLKVGHKAKVSVTVTTHRTKIMFVHSTGDICVLQFSDL